ncbi:hypothetical protein H257_17801 [Aphanomyces astaci]|uniref:Uncharacterized protein n=1 Tax=Aphanomyces astaci TaxID=112090 RepID=W4FEZ9_APHAT|nr:hypothetical protein H257_17801 [Aphanomyces astaci]ETV65464.1 hypothetical protein H257_17801 [Aphanomyces astaci]|eukprot:XP_009845046.1 hypothetical protein H257_17801 [Aphanomyces astaci]
MPNQTYAYQSVQRHRNPRLHVNAVWLGPSTSWMNLDPHRAQCGMARTGPSVASCVIFVYHEGGGAMYSESLSKSPSVSKNQIIADCMERGHGLRESTFAVNHHRVKSELPSVGQSAVYTAYQRLRPVVTTISPIKQGYSDVGSAWAIARLAWTKQLASSSTGLV